MFDFILKRKIVAPLKLKQLKHKLEKFEIGETVLKVVYKNGTSENKVITGSYDQWIIHPSKVWGTGAEVRTPIVIDAQVKADEFIKETQSQNSLVVSAWVMSAKPKTVHVQVAYVA